MIDVEPLAPAAAALLAAIASMVLGYLGYRRAMRSDRVVEQAGIATASTTSIGQVMEGLNSIITSLQKDNETFRHEAALFRTEIRELKARIAELELSLAK